MAQKDIRVPLDRTNRNNHNDNYTQLFEGVQQVKKTIDDLVLESGGDSNMEVVQARGGENTLNSRLDKFDDKDNELSSQLADKASKNEVKKKADQSELNKSKSDISDINKQLLTKVGHDVTNALSDEIANIIAQSGTSDTEVVNARTTLSGVNKSTLKERLDDDAASSLLRSEIINKTRQKVEFDDSGAVVKVVHERTTDESVVRTDELEWKEDEVIEER